MNPRLDAPCCSEAVVNQYGQVVNKEYVGAMWDVDPVTGKVVGLVHPDETVAGIGTKAHVAEHDSIDVFRKSVAARSASSGFTANHGTRLTSFSSEAGFTFGGTGVSHAYSASVVQPNGRGSVNLTSGSGTYADITWPAFSTSAATNKIGFWIYIEDPTKVQSVVLYYSETGSYANYWMSQVTNLTAWPRPGWYWFEANDSEWAATGAPALGHTFTTAKLRVTPVAGQIANVWVGDLYIGAKSKPRLVITADDGYSSWIDLAVPILNSYDIPFSWAVIGSTEAGGGLYCGATGWKQGIAAGGELITHGEFSMRTFGSSALRLADMQMNRDVVAKYDPNGSRFYVWPGGYFDPTSDTKVTDPSYINDAIASGFVSARAVMSRQGVFTQAGQVNVANRYALPIIGHNYAQGGNESTNIAAITSELSKLKNSGRSGILMFHKVVTGTPQSANEINIDTFRALIDAIAQDRADGLIDLASYSQWFAECGGVIPSCM